MEWKQDKYSGVWKTGDYTVYYHHGLDHWIVRKYFGAGSIYIGSYRNLEDAKASVDPRVYKQVIVLRKDLNMRKGKMVAQGAHASMKATLKYMDHPYTKAWLQGPFTKICVSVDSLYELHDIFGQAQDARIPCSLIKDAGRTEFDGVPTETAVAVGPAPVDAVDEITGHLKLL